MSRLTIADWDCLAQSNQYTWYGIMRPKVIMTAHDANERPPAILAPGGGTGFVSQEANVRYTVR